MIQFGLPSFGQMPQMGRQMQPMGQQMQPLGQMWQPQQGQMPTGQLPQMGQQQQMGQMPGMVPGGMGPNQGGFGQMPQFQSQMQDWRQQRPMFQGGDFRQQIQDWRGQRPQFSAFGQMQPMGVGY